MDKIVAMSHKNSTSKGKINSYATNNRSGKKINSHTGLDVPTSFTTSDRNTYHTSAMEKINFPYL